LLFGTWVQNRLDARNDDGKPKYRSFAAALGEPAKRKPINAGQLGMMPGVNFRD